MELTNDSILNYNKLKQNISNFEKKYTEIETRKKISQKICNDILEKYHISSIEELEDMKKKLEIEYNNTYQEAETYLNQCNSYLDNIKGLN